jgi:hypothetical protein
VRAIAVLKIVSGAIVIVAPTKFEIVMAVSFV